MQVVADFTGAKARHQRVFSTTTYTQSKNNDLNGCPCSKKPTMNILLTHYKEEAPLRLIWSRIGLFYTTEKKPVQ